MQQQNPANFFCYVVTAMIAAGTLLYIAMDIRAYEQARTHGNHTAHNATNITSLFFDNENNDTAAPLAPNTIPEDLLSAFSQSVLWIMAGVGGLFGLTLFALYGHYRYRLHMMGRTEQQPLLTTTPTNENNVV